MGTSGTKLPGIYVEIKGDWSKLDRDMKAAKEFVKTQATGISNALNNALSPDKINNQINSLVAGFGTLNRASSVAGKTFDSLGVDLGELRRITGLTEDQFASLQARLLKTQTANAQEAALKRLATQLRLNASEVNHYGVQFGLSSEQVERVNKAVGNLSDTGTKKMSVFGGGIAMAAGKFLLLEQAVYSAQRILNATVFDFNATVETATVGIAAAFLNNGQYVDKTTGKVLAGQQAMKAAMQDADSVIQQLRASNMVTIATLDQLIKAYQEAAPVALSKGFNKDQVEQFTVAMMQAAGAVDTTGMLIGQMGEEMRSLLNGGINPKNTRIATALGITNEDVNKYQGDIQGLFNFLMSKLSAYQAFGDQLQKTWRGVASNTVDVFQQVAAQATEPLFVSVRDGLYEWQQGIAKVVTVTDELGNKTKKLEWNPEFTKGIDESKKGIDQTVILLKQFHTISNALLGLDVTDIGIIGYTLFKSGPNMALIATTLAVINNFLKNYSLNLGSVKDKYFDMTSSWGKLGGDLVSRDWSTGELKGVDDKTRQIDNLKRTLASFEEQKEFSENHSFIASIFGGDYDGLDGKIAKVKAAIISLESISSISPSYIQNTNYKKTEEWLSGHEKLIEMLRSEREEIVATYEERKKYADTPELQRKLEEWKTQKLALVDEKEKRKERTLQLREEKDALKELSAQITGYTADARTAANAASQWNREAEYSLNGIVKLNDDVANFSGMGEFASIAYESAQLLKDGSKDIDAYRVSLAEAEQQISLTGKAYDLANNRLTLAKAALASNGAGSDTQDANKVRALEKEVADLDVQLREHTRIYYELSDAQKLAISKTDQLKESLSQMTALKMNMQAYRELGTISNETFSQLVQKEENERDKFIAATGDKEAAQLLFVKRMREYSVDVKGDEWTQGIKHGLEEVADQAKLTGRKISDYIVGAFDDANDALVNLLSGEGGDVKALLHSMSKDMLSMTTKSMIMAPAANWLSSMIPGAGGGIGGTTTISSPALVQINGAGAIAGLDGLTDIFSSDAAGNFWDDFQMDGTITSSSLWDDFGTKGSSAFSDILSGIGDFFSGGGSGMLSSIGSFFGFANGGIMSSAGPLPLRSYANGGIANSPQLALFGEGRMNEAYVPLPDGRSIPVTMRSLQKSDDGMSDGETKALLREVVNAVRQGGSTRIINAFDSDTVANAMSGSAGERVILNHVKRNISMINSMRG